MRTWLRMVRGEVWALLAVFCAFVGLTHISGNPSILRNLVCFKSCCRISCQINCSWEVPVGIVETISVLNVWYEDVAKELQPFTAGYATSILFSQNDVYILENATAWVESRTQDGRLLRSENRTFLFHQANKFHSPSAASITISRSKGLMTLAWPESHNCYHLPREKEARVRPPTVANWALGNCTPAKDDGVKERAAVVCHVQENVPYEVQIRYRISHWSSYWSDWSPSVVVPVEILRSPEINFTVGRLGGDGLRNVTLKWEGPSPDQGMVNYTLVFVLLLCQGCLTEMETFVATVCNQTSYQVALSGAAYNISLQAANKAGKALASFVRLPPEQEAGSNILNVSLSGQNFKAWWKAPVDADICFESQALGDFPLEMSCDKYDLVAGKVYENSGMVKPNRCYRLAIHGLNLNTMVWSTFGFTHLFQRNASLEDPIYVNVTKRTSHSATVRWEPPGVILACPGVLKKFVVCCQKDEEGAQTTYYDANASKREFTIPDLQPQTGYLVGVWASTDGSGKDCKAHLVFLTSPPDAKPTALAQSFLALGIFVAFLTAAGSCWHFGRKWIQRALWPPLPDPNGTEAVKILSTATSGQVHGWQHFMEPLEFRSTVEPFLVEKGETSHATEDTKDSRGLIPAIEELKPPIEDPLSSGDPLASEYKAQGLLNPVEEEPQGREGGEELPHHEKTASAIICEQC